MVARNVHALTFSPQPKQIIESDPVVRYQLNLASGTSLTLRYEVGVGATSGKWSKRLAQLATNQAVAQTSYLKSIGQQEPTSLVAMRIAPASLSLRVGQADSVTLSGTMSNGLPAPASLLERAGWKSTNSTVASVANGTIKGVTAGNVTVSAGLSSLTAVVEVTVSSPAGQSVGASTPGAPGSAQTVPPAGSPKGGSSLPVGGGNTNDTTPGYTPISSGGSPPRLPHLRNSDDGSSVDDATTNLGVDDSRPTPGSQLHPSCLQAKWQFRASPNGNHPLTTGERESCTTRPRTTAFPMGSDGLPTEPTIRCSR